MYFRTGKSRDERDIVAQQVEFGLNQGNTKMATELVQTVKWE